MGKINETLLPEKKDIHDHLNMEDITYGDYTHAKRVCKNFKIKNLGEYHDSYVQSNTLLIPDVFENFQMYVLKYMKQTLLDLIPDQVQIF